MAKTQAAAATEPTPLSLADAQQAIFGMELRDGIVERAEVLLGNITAGWKEGLLRPTEKQPHPEAFKRIVEEGQGPADVVLFSPDPEILFLRCEAGDRELVVIMTDSDVVKYRRTCHAENSADKTSDGYEHYNAPNQTWVNLFRWLAVGSQE